MTSSPVTIVGGGLAGLTAAISCAEQGAEATALEAHRELGGRARSCDGPFIANLGPHALYRGRQNWAWLAKRKLLPPTAKPPASGVRYRYRGRTTRLPPAAPWRVLKLARHSAPVGTDFRGWTAAICGEETAEQLSRIATAVTFDHDPGRLSAAFVWERLRWVYTPPPAVRFVLGGWSPLVERLAQHARQLGVTIATGRRVTELPPPPVIVATELDQARELLGDDTLRWDGARTLLLDLGLESKRGDPAALFDLDAGGFIERYTSCDRSLAPPGHELVQAQVGLRPGETAEEANARIERGLDAGFAGWRERLVWHRRQLVDARSGALDLPGRTWRERPAIDRGAGIYLAGDMTAAPGVLSEVSFTSALHAARLAVAWQPRRPTDRSADDEG